jgi:cytochrome b561
MAIIFAMVWGQLCSDALMDNGSNSPFSPWQRRLHWLLALLLVAMLTLGFYSSTLVLDHPDKALVLRSHQVLGCMVLILGLVRFRARRPLHAMNYPSDISSGQQKLARWVQGLLYVLPILLPLLGMALTWFDPFLSPNTSRGGDISDQQADWADHLHTLHYFSAWLLVLLVPIHIVAALKHYVGANGRQWRQRMRW